MTPKQRVLKKWPKAVAEQYDGYGSERWRIWPNTDLNNYPASSGRTAAEAWRWAAMLPEIRRASTKGDGRG